MWVIFLVTRMIPSFIDHGPKVGVLMIAIGDWPEMAKIRDEPRKIIPTSETENISQDKYSIYFYKL